MKLALALALAPGVSAQQQHMLRGAQGPTIALDRFAGFDAGAGPLSYAELPAAARTLSHKFSKYERDGKAAYQAAFDGYVVAGEHSTPDGNVVAEHSTPDGIVAGEHSTPDGIVAGKHSKLDGIVVAERFKPDGREMLSLLAQLEVWEDYKLSDAIKGWNRRKGLSVPFIDHCCDAFPGSIVCDYRRVTQRFGNVAALTRIVENRGRLYHFHTEGCLSLPARGETVIHLRLGDTVDRLPNRYVQEIGSYRDLVGKNLTIVSNAYRTRERDDKNVKRVETSLQYVRNLTTFLQRETNRIRYRTCLPDEDFVYMAHATHYRPAGGGFSRLVARVNAELRRVREPGRPPIPPESSSATGVTAVALRDRAQERPGKRSTKR